MNTDNQTNCQKWCGICREECKNRYCSENSKFIGVVRKKKVQGQKSITYRKVL